MIRDLVLRSGAVLDLSGPPLVMGIINCTEDSFYAPSRSSAGEAVERALAAVADGAAIVDFGGESTRPGAAYVSEEEELARVVPVIREFRRRSPAAVSVDTRKAAVAAAALDAGADIVNDVAALEDDPAMAGLCARENAAVVLMHKKGIPEHMQENPYYEDAAAEVRAYLLEAADRACRAGILRERIILDPGIGFGKRLEDNLDLLGRLAEIGAAGYPILAGLSRKSFVGALTGRAAEDRLPGTLGAAAAILDVLCSRGGSGISGILRVHDVRETVDFIKVWYAVAVRRIGG